MSVKIIKEDKTKLELELKSEDHTMGNLLRSTLLLDKHVKQAGYQIIHPLTGGIKLVVYTDGEESPREAVLKALSKIEEDTKELQEKLGNLLK
ncbi:MAG: RpoL/Rpb11 RNA polymerase subunit family protein [Candidatus Methanomethylicaceae archaeon]